MSASDSSIPPIIRAKKIAAIYPTVGVLSLFILSLLYTAAKEDLYYMDYIEIIYIIFIFSLIIISSINRRWVCLVIRSNVKLMFTNKGKGAIIALIALIYFGYTKNTFHFIMNILLFIVGIMLFALDFLIVGDWDTDEEDFSSTDQRNIQAISQTQTTEGNVDITDEKRKESL